MIGKGKYDELGAILRSTLDADGLLLVVFGGKLGNGTACKVTPDASRKLPHLLRLIADEMERDNNTLGIGEHSKQ